MGGCRCPTYAWGHSPLSVPSMTRAGLVSSPLSGVQFYVFPEVVWTDGLSQFYLWERQKDWGAGEGENREESWSIAFTNLRWGEVSISH